MYAWNYVFVSNGNTFAEPPYSIHIVKALLEIPKLKFNIKMSKKRRMKIIERLYTRTTHCIQKRKSENKN